METRTKIKLDNVKDQKLLILQFFCCLFKKYYDNIIITV